MKTYQILLLDKITRKVEKTEDFKGTKENLRHRLSVLQREYCEGETPSVEEITVTSRVKECQILIAESDSDYSYMAAV